MRPCPQLWFCIIFLVARIIPRPGVFLKKWKWLILSIFSVIVGLLFYRLFTDETFLIGPSRTHEMVGRAKYMLSQPAVIVFYYLKMLLFPINLNIDPDIEIVISVLSLSFLIPVLCMALLLVGSFRIFKSRFIFFFLCWFFIILSPSSSIVTLHDLAAEHRIYLSSAGIFILLAYSASELTRKWEETQATTNRSYFLCVCWNAGCFDHEAEYSLAV